MLIITNWSLNSVQPWTCLPAWWNVIHRVVLEAVRFYYKDILHSNSKEKHFRQNMKMNLFRLFIQTRGSK